MLFISTQLQIPDYEFEFAFARSSGPGGQNVNKVNSKAILRWSVVNSPSLREETRALIIHRLASRMNFDGELVISSDRFRDQGRNKEDCLEKLRELLVAATHIPKVRKKTKPSRSSKMKKLESKTRHAAKKSHRRKPRHDD